MRLFSKGMKDREITHIGTVSSITQGVIHITVEANSACAGCHAKGSCTIGETSEKIIHVNSDKYSELGIGEQVTVVITREAGFFAVIMAYLLPVAIIILTLWGFGELNFDELTTFSFMIAVIAIYFIILYLLRKKILKKINIKIKR